MFVIGLLGAKPWLDRPISLVGFFVCGQPHSIVAIYRSGKIRNLIAGSPEVGPLIDQVPDGNKLIVRGTNGGCASQRPKVY